MQVRKTSAGVNGESVLIPRGDSRTPISRKKMIRATAGLAGGN
jgi:hypothetical protein